MSGAKIRHRRDSPCPVCGGFDEMARGAAIRCHGWTTGDGYVHCSREQFAGALLPLQESGGTWAHRAGRCRCGVDHGDEPATLRQMARRPVEPSPAPEPRFADLHERLLAHNGRESAVVRLAVTLGVSPDALHDLETGWTGEAWSWARFDALDRVVGIGYRAQDGRRWCEPGSRHGIVGAVPVHGPVIVTEGESDAAAARTLGLPAIAVPGAGACAEIVRDLARGRDLMVIADADDAGRRGARRIAATCLRSCASARIIEPPGGAKDLRDAMLGGLEASALLAALDDAQPLTLADLVPPETTPRVVGWRRR